MAPAVDALRAAAAGVSVSDPGMVLLSNADGKQVRSGADWLDRIVTQVSAPVRWDACLRAMAALGASAFVELPPGGTLTGLARRELPGLATVALKTPGDLGAARSLLAEHGAGGGDGPQQDAAAGRGGAEPQQAQQDTHAPDWRLLVSPLAGTFRAGSNRDAAAPGASVHAGAPLGRVEERRGQQEITPSFPATILEWLVEDGDPVDAGQPLVRLQPEGTAS
jgi:[acyl-carrier-protein] S-malonyltransferase